MKIVILAGGSGTRLWPLSREDCPKQFLCPLGERSLLQQTLERVLSCFLVEDIVLVAQDRHYPLIQSQCLAIGLSPDQLAVVVETHPRSTATAFALALSFLEKEQKLFPYEPVLLMPSDIALEKVEEFWEQVEKASSHVEEGKVVVFGVAPSSIDTSYGYMELGKEDKGLYPVVRFIEKPPYEVARQLCSEKRVIWNTGHVLLCAETFWREMAVWDDSIALLRYQPHNAEHTPCLSLDYVLLENTEHLYAARLSGHWSDLGSWDSWYHLLPKEGNNNVLQGDVSSMDTKGCLIVSSHRKVLTIGIEDLLLVETADAVLLCKKGDSQKVKLLAQSLRPEYRNESFFVQRPWGSYSVLDKGPGYKVKKICVLPGKRLSLQFHYKRSEQWTVVKGIAEVSIEEECYSLQIGQTITIAPLQKHRLMNASSFPLELIEVQLGIVEEEDIVRVEDDYAREKECLYR